MTEVGEVPPVSWQVHDDIFVITIDNPPVNALTSAVRFGLLDALNAISDGIDGVVLSATGRHFVAGSDIREFDGPIPAPELPSVLDALDACHRPIAALLHGAVLGGGLELALACDLRIAASDTRLGLPEVKLGLVPGAGGTQRLPRAVGRSAALDLATSGSQIDAGEALRLGLIDEVLGAEADPIATAAKALRRLSHRRILRDVTLPDDGEQRLDEALARARARINAYPHVARIIDLVCTSAPIDQALRDERAAFHQLRNSPESAALRYAMLAERTSSRPPSNATGHEVRRVGVVGAGTMGRSIALACTLAGIPVLLSDTDAEVLRAAEDRLTQTLDDRVDRSRMTPHEAGRAAARITYDAASAHEADFVIEAVVEDTAIKQQVLSDLSARVAAGTVLATNTSYLDIDELAGASERRSMVVGMHFFHPANVMKLVEIIPGTASSADTVATAFRLAARLGKVPVLAANREGFIGNRIYRTYRAQAEALLIHGCLPAQVDQAMRDFGFAMGPFQVADSSGLDIAWSQRRRQRALGTLAPAPTVADLLCELGRLGVKSGAGWYSYAEGARKPISDPIVEELIADASKDADAGWQSFTPSQIQHALVGSVIGAAANAVADGTTLRPSDVDVVWLNGYGFPRVLGGPIHWGRRQDRGALLTAIRAASIRTGDDHDDASIERLLGSDHVAAR